MWVLLHTGKGGVGKTTLALATALAAANHGHRVCVLSTDPAHSLADALAIPVGPDMKRVADGVWAREIRAQTELDRAWTPVQAWLRALIREDADDLVAEELLAFPGIEELMALRAVREAEASGMFDTCVVDCAPTGSTMRLLRFPDALRIFMTQFFELERRGARVLRPVVRGLGGGGLVPEEEFFDAFERLYEIDDVQRILLDGERTSARLVVNLTRVVVDETRRSYAYSRSTESRRMRSWSIVAARGGGGLLQELAGAEEEELARSNGASPCRSDASRSGARGDRHPGLASSDGISSARDPAARLHRAVPFESSG